jgi:type II secretory pathway pseudopilin PulG
MNRRRLLPIHYRGFTLVELVVSIGLFMVAISVSLVATVGTNSLIARTDARSAIAESARSVTDTLRRTTENAPVGSVILHGYYGGNPDSFAGVQVKAFSAAQATTTCEVVGRATPSVTANKEEIYTLDTAGTVVAYWVYRVDSSLQCPALGTQPLYQNRLTSKTVKVTAFEAQMNSYDCDPSANCTTKQQLRYSVTLEQLNALSGRSAETRTASTTVASSLPIGLIGTGIIPLNILTTELPDGEVGSPYYKEILGEGGKLPYAWSHTGTLVAGITISQQGNKYVLSGTPTATGTANITVTVHDSSASPLTDQQQFIFSVSSGTGGGSLQISTTVLPIGVVNSPYSALLQATGGVGSLSWTILAGSLPPGLSLAGSTGQISGIPSTAGLYQFTVQVTDSALHTDTKNLSILIDTVGGGGVEEGETGGGTGLGGGALGGPG